MKRFLPLLYILLLSKGICAQNTNQFILTFGYSNSQPMYNRQVNGGLGFEGNGAPSIGLRYLLRSANAITLETGVEYIQHRYTAFPNIPPNMSAAPIKEKVQMLSIPIYAHLSFLKYFFFQCGPMVDLELNKKNTIQKQTGMGLGVGIGGNIKIQKLSIIINPFAQRHALLTFSNKQGTNMSLINAGMRLGLAYSL